MRGKVRNMNATRIAAAVAVAAGSAWADAVETTNAVEAVDLPSVVIEASRLGKTSKDIPAHVQVITREQIAAGGSRNIVDALEKGSSSLNIIRTGAGNPSLAQISLRGYGENGFGRTLVAVDGQRLNFADMSAPMLSSIDLSSVSRVEILHGSQSVLHGDAASAGMINIVTEPADYDTHGRLSLHGGSWDTFGANASYAGGDEGEGIKYWANGGYEHSDGYRANNGWQTMNVNGGLRKDWENGSYLRVTAFENDADYELPGYLSAADWKHHRTRTDMPNDWYRRTTGGLNLTGELVLNDENRLKLDLSFSRSRMKSRSFYSGSYTDYNPNNYWAPTRVDWTDDYRLFYDLYSYELTPQWINTTELAGLENEFILGTTYRYDRLHGSTHDRGVYMPDFWGMTKLTKTNFEYNRQSMAFFAQDTLHLTDWLALEAGGRYQRNWNENTALVSPRRVTDVYAADAGLLLTPVEDLKAYLKFSRFFRNPFLDENPYKNYLAQKVLSPETGWSVDVGADYTFLDDFTVFANAFVSKTKHEILYDKFYWGTNVNAPCDVIREGFTLGGSWEKEKVAGVSLAYTYVDAEFDGGVYDGKDVPMSPESTLTANARVWLWDECFVFGGYRFLSSRRAYSDFYNEGSRLASTGVFHLGAQYAPTWEWLQGFTFGFTVDNLFDRHYADSATRSASGYEVYYPAAGRSYMFTVSYEF